MSSSVPPGETGDSYPGLERLQRALASAQMEEIRDALAQLTPEEQEILEARIGTDDTRRVYRHLRRARRGARLGRVIVIHGLMGARLDAVDKGGDADRIWVNYFRLLRGRIKELELKANGDPANPRYNIRLGGIFPEYLPLLTELDEQWNVIPFDYDWRKTIDESADRLRARIEEWSNGEPVHLVTHSMGGLVARRFIQRHADLWRTIADPNGLQRGGRLIMLGTPNRGSFAISLALTGQEKVVKILGLLDVPHDQRDLLQVIDSFPGPYQLLPSPLQDFGDDRRRLFTREAWGNLPVQTESLDSAERFQTELDEVTDPQRLLFVAGHDRKTPYRIRVDGPGRFFYRETMNGDGRVPHESGLLPNVATFWVREKHGDLPRNRSVLAAIHDLLLRGQTAELNAGAPPVTRARPEEAEWKPANDVDAAPEGLEELLSKSLPRRTGRRLRTPRRNGGDSTADPEQVSREAAERVEAEMLSDYVGTPSDRAQRVGVDTARAGVPQRRQRSATAATAVPLKVDVVWGDVRRVDADVYAVGHYENVLPQNAEAALDEVVSPPRTPPDRRVIATLTRRGVLRGALGEVYFYPWAEAGKRDRHVAVAGMGYQGGFGAPELRRLALSLATHIMALPNVRRVCTVLIGSGVGNLPVPVAVEGLILGLADALTEAALDSAARSEGARKAGQMKAPRSPVELLIVELGWRRAQEVHRALAKLRGRPDVQDRLELVLGEKIVPGEGGSLGTEHCLAVALASTLAATRPDGDPTAREALDVILREARTITGFDEQREEAFAWARRRGTKAELMPFDLQELAEWITVGTGSAEARGAQPPTRIGYVLDPDGIRVSALTQTAVLPERPLGFDPALLRELIRRMIDPDPELFQDLSDTLARLIVPQDFRNLIERAPSIVFEVDRNTAQVHWEMLARTFTLEGPYSAIALEIPVARQLRTAYSPAPNNSPPVAGPLRALVIGDPGDPKTAGLPGAAREAREVAELLRARGVDVVEMIGAPGPERSHELDDVEPATRLDVLSALMTGKFDLLHYAGHGSFHPRRPDRTGWLFKDGILTARELERIDAAPRLVVANACLSGLTSQTAAGRMRRSRLDLRREASLLPALADEFFRRGVRDYIGTAWEVNDVGAVTFAKELYSALLPEQADQHGATLGDAILSARKALQKDERQFGALWAAYQHYGDPTRRFVDNPAASRRDEEAEEEARDALEAEGDGNGERPKRAVSRRGRTSQGTRLSREESTPPRRRSRARKRVTAGRAER